MTLTLIIISVVVISSFLIVYRQLTEKKKYQDTTYLSNLQLISLFFDTIQRFDDYVTWVQLEQIKTRFSSAKKFFKNKSNFYKKEENVKKFNDIIPLRSDFAQTMNESERAVMMKHIAYWTELMAQGKVLAFGPVLDPDEIYGLGIVSVDNEQEVIEFIANDPAGQINKYEYFPMKAVVPSK